MIKFWIEFLHYEYNDFFQCDSWVIKYLTGVSRCLQNIDLKRLSSGFPILSSSVWLQALSLEVSPRSSQINTTPPSVYASYTFLIPHPFICILSIGVALLLSTHLLKLNPQIMRFVPITNRYSYLRGIIFFSNDSWNEYVLLCIPRTSEINRGSVRSCRLQSSFSHHY